MEREKRLAREWLMSGGEEDLNDNGIADELEQAHMEESKPKRTTLRGLIRRMVDEAEEDWNEHGNKPLPGASQTRSSEEPEGEEPEDSEDETGDYADDETGFSDEETDLTPEEGTDEEEASDDAGEEEENEDGDEIGKQ